MKERKDTEGEKEREAKPEKRKYEQRSGESLNTFYPWHLCDIYIWIRKQLIMLDLFTVEITSLRMSDCDFRISYKVELVVLQCSVTVRRTGIYAVRRTWAD